MPRIATLNVTLSNIELHAKTAKTDPEPPYRNSIRAHNTNRCPTLLTKKIFSRLILTLTQRFNMQRTLKSNNHNGK